MGKKVCGLGFKAVFLLRVAGKQSAVVTSPACMWIITIRLYSQSPFFLYFKEMKITQQRKPKSVISKPHETNLIVISSNNNILLLGKELHNEMDDWIQNLVEDVMVNITLHIYTLFWIIHLESKHTFGANDWTY